MQKRVVKKTMSLRFQCQGRFLFSSRVRNNSSLPNHKIQLLKVIEPPQKTQSKPVHLKAAQNGARFGFHVPIKNNCKIENPANEKVNEALEGPQLLWATSMVFVRGVLYFTAFFA